ncbi:NnrS family protein [Planctobacterium marinum]|uniref:NnrS family protein n=1 Tax=Planctobacterium marinum TaxID=1631968 RepID=A0AA48HLS2_9ALTE|nr:hypothetical protein MACH26_03330 [Planctobacterium marinum]
MPPAKLIPKPIPNLKQVADAFFNLPLWHLAFRACFLLASISSVFAIVTWLGILNNWWRFSEPALTPTLWHLHEMLFGFAATVAIGFTLTAVQTWTGLASIKGRPLALFMLLWLIARLVFWFNHSALVIPAIVVQMLWWVAAIWVFARLLIQAQNRRNYLLIAVFTLMAVLNLSILLADISGNTALALHLGRSMVLMFTLLMAIIAGRVIPFFTERGIGSIVMLPTPKTDQALLWVSATSIALFITGHFMSLPVSPAVLFIASGGLHLYRLVRWYHSAIFTLPLLWSLHGAYLFLALGLLATGVSFIAPVISLSAALHLITIGAIGLMILSMMSRVSLGHTGRPLTPKPLMSMAFVLLATAALVRAILPGLGAPVLSWQLSSLLWLLALLIFLLCYCPVLLAPRKQY